MRCLQNDGGAALHPEEADQALALKQYAAGVVQESARKTEDAERGSETLNSIASDAT